MPQRGDDVFINHTIATDTTATINNLYVSGTLSFNGNYTLNIRGDLQATGSVNMSSVSATINLFGVNNYIVNYTTSATSTISYSRLGDQDLMYLPYANLILTGSGKKNITTDLTINGTTSITASAVMYKKTSTGKLTFIGQLSGSGIAAAFCGLDNSINADVELRGGISYDCRFTTMNFGSGNLYFNGTQVLSFGGGSAINNYNTILIKGTSIVTLDGGNTPWVIKGSLNGETSSSTFRVVGLLYQGTSIEPMTTGVYSYNYGGASTIGYVFNGNYTLPYTSYGSLFIQGTGIKTLGGDTTLSGGLTVSSGSLELSSSAFTVSGATTFTDISSNITKNSSTGYTTFIGVVDISSPILIGYTNYFSFNNSGATIEFRNGLLFDVRGCTPTFANGTTIKFTTNNQVIDSGGNVASVWGCNILISGAITVTNQNWGCGITGTLNGDNASSQFNNIVSFNYQNSQQPMQTGILSSNNSGSKNAFIYGLSGNQDIEPGNYYNLILNGNGVKRLLGNVSVKGTYTLTNPATLNSNGFALTNP